MSRKVWQEPVEPCTCKEGWKPVGAKFCSTCFEGQIDLLTNALDNSQSLLVATLHGQPPIEDLEAQIVENREVLTPGFFDTPSISSKEL